MNTTANLDAIRKRMKGENASRFRAVALAGTAGAGVATAVYRVMRGADRS